MASELQKAVNALILQEPGWKPFEDQAKLGARPGGITTGFPSTSRSGQGGFEESDYTLRTYWPASTASQVISSDGIFVFEVAPIKTVSLVGNGKASFKEPV